MPPDANPARDFGSRLFRLGLAWRREMDQGMRQLGLSDGTWRPVLHLGRKGDGLRQTELAASLGIEGPSLVRLLDRLERTGLLERRADPGDRRSKTLWLTPAGREALERIEAAYAATSDRLLGKIGAAELERCLEVLARIERALLPPRPALAREARP